MMPDCWYPLAIRRQPLRNLLLARLVDFGEGKGEDVSTFGLFQHLFLASVRHPVRQGFARANPPEMSRANVQDDLAQPGPKRPLSPVSRKTLEHLHHALLKH